MVSKLPLIFLAWRKRFHAGTALADSWATMDSDPRVSLKEGSEICVLSRKLGEKIYISDNICITSWILIAVKIRLGSKPRAMCRSSARILGDSKDATAPRKSPPWPPKVDLAGSCLRSPPTKKPRSSVGFLVYIAARAKACAYSRTPSAVRLNEQFAHRLMK